MQRMPMIPPELGVGAFEGRVAVGLWPLDPAVYSSYQHPSPQKPLIAIANPSRKPQNHALTGCRAHNSPVAVRLFALVVL
jgi:hypothetical protein